MTARLFAGFCLALTLGPAAAAIDSQADAQMWVERMNRAVQSLNYEGTFFHLRHGQVETLSITHRVEDRKVTERLVSLDANGREIIRGDGEQICYFPDQRRVLVQSLDKTQNSLLGAPTFCRNVSLNYALQIKDSERVSGRMTRLIAVNPLDNYRFGYRLWLDEQTALPIKTQLLDADGNVLEQILFARLTVSESLPKSAVQPRVNSEGFTWVRPAKTLTAAQKAAAARIAWRASKLPPGFRLVFAHGHCCMSKEGSVAAHLVYSDGLASVSVFVEESPKDGRIMKGPSRVGSSYVFSTVVDKHQVTAVGEVPVQTVRLIAGSIQPDAPSVAEQR